MKRVFILLTLITIVYAGAACASEPLLEAAGDGDAIKVKALLDAGVDVNVKSADGETALMRAAEGGHMEVAQILLSKGADVNAKDIYGWTALVYAAWANRAETARLLIAKGAHVKYAISALEALPKGEGSKGAMLLIQLLDEPK